MSRTFKVNHTFRAKWLQYVSVVVSGGAAAFKNSRPVCSVFVHRG